MPKPLDISLPAGDTLENVVFALPRSAVGAQAHLCVRSVLDGSILFELFSSTGDFTIDTVANTVIAAASGKFNSTFSSALAADDYVYALGVTYPDTGRHTEYAGAFTVLAAVAAPPDSPTPPAPPALLYVLDFTTSPAGAGTLPFGWTLSRALAGTTVQNSSALITGIAANTPRIGRELGNAPLALRNEPTRTNFTIQSRSQTTSPWTTQSATGTGGQTSPDGTSVARRWQVAAGQLSNLQAVAILGVNTIASVWVRATTATSPVVLGFGTGIGVGSFQWFSGSVDTNFRPVATHAPLIAGGTANQSVTGVDLSAAGSETDPAPGQTAQDIITDCWQSEQGQYATSFIPTTTTPVTRDGDLLAVNAVTMGGFLNAGRLAVNIRFRPDCAPTQADADQYLWYIDATHNAKISATTGRLTITSGTSSWSPITPCAWSAGDVVEFITTAGGGVVSTAAFMVNGVNIVDLGDSPLPLPNISAAGMYVANNSTGGQLSAWIERVEFYS